MKQTIIALSMAAVFFAGASYADEPATLQLGVDQIEQYGPLLKNKKVGLIVNQSSLDSTGQHTIDKLVKAQAAYGFKVTTLFSVEHGLRGKADAGAGDKNTYSDSVTKLPVVTLYGTDEQGKPNKHPSEAELKDVDILIYDLQDVGVRFYTYTLSLHWIMESAQQYNKEVMVFDRPNPNGNKMYGPLLQQPYVSGIGMHPIPMVHGLTSAEFANMIQGEGWLNGVDNPDNAWDKFKQPAYQLPKNKLHLITMKNYDPTHTYSLPVRPSPNLPNDLAVALFPSLGLFEATSVNMGRGSDLPHQQMAFPNKAFYVNTTYVVNPEQTKYGWPQGGKTVWGEKLTQLDPKALQPTIHYFVDWWLKMKDHKYQYSVSAEQEKNYLDHAEKYFIIRPSWLAKLVGDTSLLTGLEKFSAQETSLAKIIGNIEAQWTDNLNTYKATYQNYTLY